MMATSEIESMDQTQILTLPESELNKICDIILPSKEMYYQKLEMTSNP